ncbi:MAG TPA: hypothetical protein VLE02_01360 [Nitrosarchaeum sp.]|nr:hypothetical protein [Nitrosarchaeum sp.]
MAKKYDFFEYVDFYVTDDFYFVYNALGVKMYFNCLSGERVSKYNIPIHLRNQIQEGSSYKMSELNTLKKRYEQQIDELFRRLNNVNTLLNNPQELQTKKRKRDEYITQRFEILEAQKKQKVPIESRPNLSPGELNFFQKSAPFYYSVFSTQENKFDQIFFPNQPNLLEKLKLTTKDDWIMWLLEFSSEKENSCYHQVIEEGKRKGWNALLDQ